ncbi:class I SAM-dependent methyltransferase [Kitasatospora sp. NPDC096147]|uniref:class I SAM-dependent methyltransferase n=1 Tax=Kitasatospora sp. NPDC096147 TaxID=3364093 RepID=UPI0038227ADE
MADGPSRAGEARTTVNRFAGWDWENPETLAVTLDGFSAGVAVCEKLEPMAEGIPRTRAEFQELGLTGIEFAAFRTDHPNGLGSDLTPLRSATAVSESGTLYRVDGDRCFTQLDISRPLPFEDGVVDWIYAEHLIEHVPLNVALYWLKECHRVLAPGGLLRITTPDLAKYLTSYVQDDGFLTRHRRRLSKLGFGPPMPDRKAFLINQIFAYYGHRWIYDQAELTYVLTEAGFDAEAVRLCAYRVGLLTEIADLDTAFRSDETIYVEVQRRS